MSRSYAEWILLIATTIGTVSQMQGEFLGHHAKVDFGLMSGSQPGPGFYSAPMYFR